MDLINLPKFQNSPELEALSCDEIPIDGIVPYSNSVKFLAIGIRGIRSFLYDIKCTEIETLILKKCTISKKSMTKILKSLYKLKVLHVEGLMDIEDLEISNSNLTELKLTFCETLHDFHVESDSLKRLTIESCHELRSVYFKTKQDMKLDIHACEKMSITGSMEQLTDVTVWHAQDVVSNFDVSQMPKLRYFDVGCVDIHEKYFMPFAFCQNLRKLILRNITYLSSQGSEMNICIPTLETLELMTSKTLEKATITCPKLTELKLLNTKSATVYSKELRILRLVRTRLSNVKLLQNPMLEKIYLLDDDPICIDALASLPLQNLKTLQLEFNSRSKGIDHRKLSKLFSAATNLKSFVIRRAELPQWMAIHHLNIVNLEILECESISKLGITCPSLKNLKLRGSTNFESLNSNTLQNLIVADFERTSVNIPLLLYLVKECRRLQSLSCSRCLHIPVRIRQLISKQSKRGNMNEIYPKLSLLYSECKELLPIIQL